MALPGDLTATSVTGSFRAANGQPVQGTVTFTPTATLSDPTGTTIIPAFPSKYSLQAGAFESDPLAATDNADLEPAGWAYEIVVSLQDIPSYTFYAPLPSAPSTVDLTDLQPVYPPGAATGTAGGNYLPATGGTETGTLVLDATPPLKVPGATLGQILVSDASGNFTVQTDTSTNATAIDGVTVTGTVAPGRTIIVTGSGTASWQLPLQVDTTAADIQPLASSAGAGALTQAAAADHIHPTTGLVTTSVFPLPVSDGGTGSSSKNFADLTTGQNIGGVKTFTGEILVPYPPVNSGDAAPKAYVDAVAQGLSPKNSCAEATVNALPSNTYSNGSSGVGATLTATATGTLTVDGQTVALGDRVLVQDEVTAANNGIYLCTTAGAPGVAYVLTRSTDMDTSAQIAGAFCFVEKGANNGGSQFAVASSGPYTVGTTAISFTLISGPADITAGTGLTESGSTISLSVPVTVADGGTGATTGGAALASLAGASTAGDYLRGTGSAIALSAIQGADLPAATSGTQGAMLLGAAGYCLVVAASNATSKVKNGADYVCTGTNDHTAINSAITALPAGGGRVQLSAGTFSIGGPIAIAASNVSLEGTGVSTEIAVTSGSDLTAAITILGAGVVECKIRRLWIQGSLTDTNGSGIRISTPWSTTDTQHVVEDVYITNCVNNGLEVPVYLTGTTKSDTRVLLINRVHVKNCHGNGFYLAYPSCTDSVFTDCIADTCELSGFYIGGANCWFTNCKTFYCGSGGAGNYGFCVTGYNNYFEGCQAQDNYYSGFYGDNSGDATYGAFGCTFVNCTADNNGQSGGSTAVGWNLNGVKQWQIIGGIAMCRPYATGPWQDYGVWLHGTGTNNTISDVLFFGNVTSPILDASTGPTYTLNNTYSTGTAPSNLGGKLTVPSLQVTTGATSGYVLTSDASGNATWVAGSGGGGGASLDSTATDIQPSGIQAAGATGKAADAGHVHPGVINVRSSAYGAKGNGQFTSDATVSLSTPTTLTSASDLFVTTDTGKTIVVYGAGVAGAHLSTTITYVSAGQVTLGTAASTAVSGAIMVWGTNDTTAIVAAVTAAAASAPATAALGAHASVYLPEGIYMMTSGLGNLNGARIYGDGPGNIGTLQYQCFSASDTGSHGSTIVMTTANTSSLVNSTSYGFHEFDHLNIIWTAAGGKIFAGEGYANDNPWIHDCRFEVNDPGGNGQVVASFTESPFDTWERCSFVQTAAVRQLPLYQSYSTSSGAEANITFNSCKFLNEGSDHSYYMVDIEFQGASSGGDGYSMQIAFRDTIFGRCWGGAVKMLGVISPVFDNCALWDLNGGPALTTAGLPPGLLYFGEYSASSPCRGVRITGGFKNRTWADGSHVWDVYCESTTTGVVIEQFSTKPDNNTSGANFYVNLNGCADVHLRGNQSPSGNNPGTTVVSNPSPTQITSSLGQVTAAALQFNSAAETVGSTVTFTTGTTPNVDVSLANVYPVTLTGSPSGATPSFAIINAASGQAQSLTLYLTQGGSGSYTVNWPSGVTWLGGNAPVVATSIGALTVVTLETITGGTTWYGVQVAQAPPLPLPVSDGGTGLNALTTYELVAGGTGTATPVQQVGIGATGQVLTSGGSGAYPSFQAPGSGPLWGPADQGLIAWTTDLAYNNLTSSAPLATAGTLYVAALKVPAAASAGHIVMDLTVAGATLTSGQCFAALWQGAGGTLLGQTTDQSGAWAGSTGAVSMAFSAPVAVAAGIVYAGVWFNGTTGPTFMRSASTSFVNTGPPANPRWATANTLLTTTAPSTLGALTAFSTAYWFGLAS